MEAAPEEIFPSISRPGKDPIGMRGMGLSGIAETLGNTSSKKSTFTCINALDECGRILNQASSFTKSNSPKNLKALEHPLLEDRTFGLKSEGAPLGELQAHPYAQERSDY